jgi:predicted extracellular nuclease
MKKLILLLNILWAVSGFAQKETYNAANNFTVMFYNTENFFDTIDDPHTNDNQYLPAGNKQWNTVKYKNKLENIAKVIASVHPDELPEIVGLCEIENTTVLNDLIGQPVLKNGKYAAILEDSKEPRGVDVALLYRKDEFQYLKHQAIRVTFPFEKETRTRDILYVKGIAGKSDTLHIFVNHWKSRIGDEKNTETKRVFTAMLLRNYADSIMIRNPESRIIIIGDFNDDPTNKSIYSILQAGNKQKNLGPSDLYNMMFDKHNFDGKGSYYYQGDWYMFDNIIVSPALLLNIPEQFRTTFGGGQIFSPDWMMQKNQKTGTVKPFETFDGSKYINGFSDHLPVFIELKK